MTKQRAPLSFEGAIRRMSDVLPWAQMGLVIGKAPRTIQDYSDEDVSTGISLADAYAIEAAYIAAGGEGAPISDCWRLRLQCDAASAAVIQGRAPSRPSLGELVINAFKEGGEGKAALIALLTNSTDARAAQDAHREVGEWVEALTTILSSLKHGAGPGAAGEGGGTFR